MGFVYCAKRIKAIYSLPFSKAFIKKAVLFMLSDRYDGENALHSIYFMPVYCHLANTFITFTLAERDKSKK